eukprot:CAMPEP_0182529640 /NCGR_PEP_ID=MMETSP1323-20130603/5331_1 /TAXON_ID=236787 /ORGANISM="Florenciella parvula, Strain RCC1693" /LENGTH=44 /DNA_ID= /DNA_START= /DNA_END= /DNA_ORIENTATION=
MSFRGSAGRAGRPGGKCAVEKCGLVARPVRRGHQEAVNGTLRRA